MLRHSDLTNVDSNGSNIPQNALKEENINLIDALLDKGGDVNSMPMKRFSFFRELFKNKYFTFILDKFLRKGLVIEKSDLGGGVPFSIAYILNK